MPERPHIAFPPRLTSGGRLAVNEQDSPDDVASCIATILLWPRGTRRGMADFGIVSPLFHDPNLDELREDVAVSEPRATTLTPELLDEALSRGVERIRLGFDTGQTS